MEQNNISLGERIAGLVVMAGLLIPLWLICYLAYANIMMIYTGLTDPSTFNHGLGVHIIIMIFLLGTACITIPLAALAITIWLSVTYQLATRSDLSPNAAISARISTLAEKIRLPKIARHNNRIPPELTREQQEHAAENIHTGEYYQSKLDILIAQVNNPALRERLLKMRILSTNMLDYLKSNPEKTALAHQFIDYYLKETCAFVDHYIELERSNLNTPEIAAAMENIKNTIDRFEEAYKQQFSKLM